jgi:hypothetical protein
MTIAGIAIVVIGAALVASALTPFHIVRGHLDRRAGDGSADPYTPQLHRRLQIACALAGAAATCGGVAMLFLARRRPGWLAGARRRWRRDGRRFGRHARRLRRIDLVAMAGLMMIAALVRWPYLDQPMRYDESHTYLNYASQPWYVAIAKYDAPNNHILHTLAVRASARLLGDSPFAIRLPAFLAGVLLAPACYLLGVAVRGRAAGALAGLTVAAWSPLVEFSTNARGYTLVCLFTVPRRGAWPVDDSNNDLSARHDHVLAGNASGKRSAPWRGPCASGRLCGGDRGAGCCALRARALGGWF